MIKNQNFKKDQIILLIDHFLTFNFYFALIKKNFHFE